MFRCVKAAQHGRRERQPHCAKIEPAKPLAETHHFLQHERDGYHNNSACFGQR